MKIEEINERYKLFGLFNLTLAKNNLYHFDSIEEFKENNCRLKDYNQFILRDLTLETKTEENLSYRGYSPFSHAPEGVIYHLLLKDNSGNFSATLFKHSIFSPYFETWEGVVNTREGDIIDGVFIYNSAEAPSIIELNNKTIEAKI
jgi:hypothetical protein